MKKANFTLYWCCLLLFGVMAIPITTYGQQTISCTDVQISLGDSCGVATTQPTGCITPEDFLTDPQSAGPWTVTITKGDQSLVGVAPTSSGCFDFGDADLDDVKYFLGVTASYTLESGDGNKCWGDVDIEDKVPPTVEAPGNTTLYCGIDVNPSNWALTASAVSRLGKPTYSDNCDNYVKNGPSVGLAQQEGCGWTVTYVWSATWQVKGETHIASDTQTVEIIPLPGRLIELPPDTVRLPCTEADNLDPKEIEDWKYEYKLRDIGAYDDGFISSSERKTARNYAISQAQPYFTNSDGFNIGLLDDQTRTCAWIAGWTDVPLEACGGRKIVRQWNVVNWCSGESKTGENPFKYVEAKDGDGPTIERRSNGSKIVPSDFSESEQPWICVYEYNPIRRPNYEDDCSAVTGYTYRVVERNTGQELAANGNSVDLPAGVWDITVCAKDECGNLDEEECDTHTVTVEDKIAPVPVCEDEVQATMPNTNEALKIPASAFDAGSHDNNCGPVWIDVIRMEDFDGTGSWDVCDFNPFSSTQPFGSNDRTLSSDDKEPWFEVQSGCVKESTTFNLQDEDKDGWFCTSETVELTQFGEYVKFCCDDIGSDDLMVVVRVRDEDWNVSYCMVPVSIDAKYEANITCHIDPIQCVDDLDDAAITREFVENAWVSISSGHVCIDAVEADFLGYTGGVDDVCGTGGFWGTFGIDIDGDGTYEDEANCFLEVKDNVGGFEPHSIKWPPHYTGEVYDGVNIECGPDGRSDYYEWAGYYSNGAPVDDVTERGDGREGTTGDSKGQADEQYHYNVTMPPAMDCAEDLDMLCGPEWEDPACGLVGYSKAVDTVFFDSEGACKKIIIRWTIIDWCTWNPNDDPNDGKYDDFDDENDTYKEQFEAVEDWALGQTTNAGEITDGGCWMFNSCFDKSDDPGTAAQGDNVYFRYTKNGEKERVDEDGYYTFDQVIKIVDKEAPLHVDAKLDYDADDCDTDITVMASAADDGCSDDLTWFITVEGTSINNMVRTGKDISYDVTGLAPGTYLAHYLILDDCNNRGIGVDTICINDVKPPTPYCIQSLSTAVMSGAGTVTIWAIDFNQNSEDACFPEDQDALRYTFGPEPEEDTTYNEDKRSGSMTFTCDDIPAGFGIFPLEMWVWDEAGNGDYCFITLKVDDNVGACGEPVGGGSETAQISGHVSTESGDMVENAEVKLNSNQAEFPITMMTRSNGVYAFASTPMNKDYEVSAERNDDYVNGSTTLDLVKIQQHILGLDMLNSAYRVIAADVNNDSKISASDIVNLRKAILGIYTAFPDNNSWRFVDATQSFADNLNPFPFAEVIDIDQLSHDMDNQNFVAVKIGDVNGSAKANKLMIAEVRTNGTLNFVVEDAQLSSGDVVRIDVRSENFNEVYGYQFTMNHTGLSLQSVESAALNVTEDNVGVRNGVLTMSWHDVAGNSSSDVLFTMVFKANASVTLSESMSISSSVTPAEAYVGSALDQQDVSLTFRTENGVLGAELFELQQNTPNPFNDETIIGFTLPKASQATITVMDVAGKRIKVINGEYTKGYNEVRLKSDDLGAGVLYYQLESGEYTATKKMIVID